MLESGTSLFYLPGTFPLKLVSSTLDVMMQCLQELSMMTPECIVRLRLLLPGSPLRRT